MEFTAPDASKIKASKAAGSPVKRLERLLVPVDFSACAYNALSQALVLAALNDAEVNLVHAIHIPMKTATLNVGSIEALEMEAQMNLDKLMEHVNTWASESGFGKIVVKSTLVVGFPAEEIIRLADETKANLVVMGTQGAGGVEGFLLGSNAATVINRANCPVLTMPASHLVYELKKLSFATDLAVIDTDSLEQVVSFAAPFGAEVEFVHLFTPNEIIASDQLTAFEKKVKEICKYPKLNFEAFETFHDSVAESLEQYVHDYKVEVLALLKRERGFISNLFHSSVTKQMTVHAKSPLLVMHE